MLRLIRRRLTPALPLGADHALLFSTTHRGLSLMSGRRSSRRNDPSARSELGTQSHSPTKARDAHNRRRVVGFGSTFKRSVTARLNALLDGPSAADVGPSAADVSRTEGQQPGPSDHDVEMEDGWVDEPPPPPAPTLTAPVQVFVEARPDNKHISTVRAWGAMLPRLEQPFLQYRRDTHGRIPPIVPAALDHACGASCAAPYTLLVQCLYPTRK
jgi:hypothetical protein